MKIVILGGGISGLSAAWALQKKYPSAKMTLLEKSDRLGGAIQTVKQAGFLFERGPRTFQAGKCPSLLNLIQELGLSHELIFSDKGASARYLWERGRLRPIGSFIPMLFFSAIKEAFVAPSILEDESIYDFASRRFNPKIAETLFDPMTLGIYSGDIRKLSIKSCFPLLFHWEKEKGSCFQGFLFSLLSQKKSRGLFTLKEGLGSLIEALAKKLKLEILLRSEVEAIESRGVFAAGRSFSADLIVSALPGSILSSLANVPFILKEAPLWVANFCYSKNILSKKGFGYLVPSKEKEDLLGVIWDSSIFPQQNGPSKTCLTAMARSGNLESLKKALVKHLALSQEPDFVSLHHVERAVPQFEVGYSAHLAQFKEQIQKKFSHLVLLGNYLQNPSIESCIYTAEQALK